MGGFISTANRWPLFANKKLRLSAMSVLLVIVLPLSVR